MAIEMKTDSLLTVAGSYDNMGTEKTGSFLSDWLM